MTTRASPVRAVATRGAFGFRTGNGIGLPDALAPELADSTLPLPSCFLVSIARIFVFGPAKAASAGRPSRRNRPEITSERTGETARASESETVAVLQGGMTDQAQLGEKANRILDPVEVTLLMKQGEQFAAAGDLVTARIFSKELRRPAMLLLRWRWARPRSQRARQARRIRDKRRRRKSTKLVSEGRELWHTGCLAAAQRSSKSLVQSRLER